MSARNLPPRYPPYGAWPEMMRADMTAAFFDRAGTKDLAAGVVRGEVPPPCGTVGTGKARQPVWSRAYCIAFITRRYDGGLTGREPAEDLAAMV